MVATIAFGMGIDKPDVRFVATSTCRRTSRATTRRPAAPAATALPADAWMAYGLADVVNQRRMIDESPAGEEFKRNQRGKLDALLALAEAHDCRRVRLLGYFGEASAPCGAAPERVRQLPHAAGDVGRDRGGAHGALRASTASSRRAGRASAPAT